MKKIIKLFIEFVFILVFAYCLIMHELIVYGISQAIGQIKIVANTKPIDEIINEKSTSDSVKQKLILIQEIKKYSIDSIGISSSKNYSTFYDQTNQQKLYTISACEVFSFKAKEWTFPFLGTVSYKGFFDKGKAKKEISILKSNGYDVDVYSPSGWSTLGWFKDPVLSGMLKNSEGRLANLIIHELTHGTIYVKNNVMFNENLANFIGDKGAEKFLIFKYGKKSKQYNEYIENKSDEKIYNEFILKSKNSLDSLYSTFKSTDTDKFKKEKKRKLITEIVLNVNKLQLHKKQNYFNYSLQAFAEGNAFFMAFSRYDSEYEIFEKEFEKKCNSNLRNYLILLKNTYPSL